MNNEVVVLDVGHGNSTVLSNNGMTVVIDAGIGNQLLEYLSHVGINHIDVVLISHADQDHIGGVLALLTSKDISIGRVRLNTDYLKNTKTWRDLVYELHAQDKDEQLNFQPSLVYRSGENYDCGDIKIEVLGPNKALAAIGPGNKTADRTMTANSISAVILASINDAPLLLLTGDLDDIGLNSILTDKLELGCPILVFPHHGGKAGNVGLDKFSSKLFKAVTPNEIIFSIGRGKHDTPRPEIISKAKEINQNVRIVCTQLSKNCSVDLPVNKPGYLRETHSKGDELGLCCAGSIHIDIENYCIANPCMKDHSLFIKGNVPNALCVL